MSEYVAHLADDEKPKTTACGEPWQGWQAPDVLWPTVELPPHDPPRSHGDLIRQCRACMKVAMSR